MAGRPVLSGADHDTDTESRERATGNTTGARGASGVWGFA